MQQKLAQKEKAAKEENLRLLAQRARDDRAGISAPIPAKAVETGLGGALGGYGSDSGSDDTSDSEAERPSAASAAGVRQAASDDEEDDQDAREREKIRREKRQERERELRMNSMGNEQRAKMMAKWVFSLLFVVFPLSLSTRSDLVCLSPSIELLSEDTPADLFRTLSRVSLLSFSPDPLCLLPSFSPLHHALFVLRSAGNKTETSRRRLPSVSPSRLNPRRR